MGKKSLAALLCATMAMTACMLPATAAMADEPLKIEFFQQKGEEGPQKGYKEIIDKFNKENSDIEIEMNTVPDAGTVLTSRISSGDIPVIFSDFPTQTQFKQKVANGYVQDLSDQDFLKNVNESALEMTKQEDGGYYALPYSRNYIGVYYKLYMSFSLSFHIFSNVRIAPFYQLFGHFAFVVNLTYQGLTSYIFPIKRG